MEPEPKRGDCRVEKNEAVATEGFRWIGLRRLQWLHKGTARPWEAVERTTRKGPVHSAPLGTALGSLVGSWLMPLNRRD